MSSLVFLPFGDMSTSHKIPPSIYYYSTLHIIQLVIIGESSFYSTPSLYPSWCHPHHHIKIPSTRLFYRIPLTKDPILDLTHYPFGTSMDHLLLVTSVFRVVGFPGPHPDPIIPCRFFEHRPSVPHYPQTQVFILRLLVCP